MNFKVLRIDTRLIVPESKRWIALGILLGAVGLMLSVALYWALGRTLDDLLAGGDIALWLCVLAAIALARALSIWAGRLAQFKASSRTKITIRDRMYEHALKLGPSMLDQKRTGEVVNTAVNGMEWIEQLYGVYVIQFAIAILTPVLLCVYLFAIDWVAALAMVVTIPLMPTFLAVLAGRFRNSSRRSAEANNRLSAQFLDSIQGMTTLKMFNLSKVRGQQLRAENEEQRQATMKLLWINQIMILYTDLGFALGTTMVMTIVAFTRFGADAITAGTASSLVLISTEFWKPLSFIGQFFFAGGIGREIAGRILSFLNERPQVVDAPGATAPGRLVSPALGLQNLTFTYPGAARPAVDGVSLELQPGSMTALVGHSGSGKTTVTSLVMRFLQPQQGSVLLDAIPADSVTADWVREHVALVPQDPYIFYGTLRDNLRVARPDATDADIEAAARAANLWEFVQTLPQGFDTVVGERGSSLSGGQAQRVAIARALLRDAPIIVLDEPTSQIDVETESVIQEALDQLRGTKTVLLIAHRLQTAERADRIVVMSQGKIVEDGAPGELDQSGGVWARMRGIVRVAERREPLAGGVA